MTDLGREVPRARDRVLGRCASCHETARRGDMGWFHDEPLSERVCLELYGPGVTYVQYGTEHRHGMPGAAAYLTAPLTAASAGILAATGGMHTAYALTLAGVLVVPVFLITRAAQAWGFRNRKGS